MPQRGSQLLAVVGEDLRVVCAARNGNVGHAVVEQVFGSQLGIGVDQHTVGGLPLKPGDRRDVSRFPSPGFPSQLERKGHDTYFPLQVSIPSPEGREPQPFPNSIVKPRPSNLEYIYLSFSDFLPTSTCRLFL